jgi:hypothetical protein
MVADLLETLNRLGVTVRVVERERVRLEPASRIPAEMIPRIRQAKAEIIEALRARPATCAPSCHKVSTPEPSDQGECIASNWPPESLQNEHRFGCYHARLFPFVGKRVWTPATTGTLLSTFADNCEILPDGATKTVRVRAEDVRPIQ